MNKNIRSNVVRDSLLDYTKLANSLKENTEGAVKSLLSEAVRDTYAKLLTEEEDDKDYEEDEVEDTSLDTAKDADSSAMDNSEVSSDEDASLDDNSDASTDMEASAEDDASTEADDASDALADEPSDIDAESGYDVDSDEWADFDKYKVSDDEYDFTNAEDEDIVKVYKLMKNDDQILVHKEDNGNVSIQDNETGAEYLIDLDGDSKDLNDSAMDDDFGMNESTERLFEIVLEENDNVGYTDNYQNKDVMSSMNTNEPGKNVNDWDAGVPHGNSKPWSSYSGKGSKSNKPFDKSATVEESFGEDFASDDDDTITELKTNAEHSANVGSTSRTDGPNNPRTRKGRNFHTAQRGFEQSTSDNPYNSRAMEEGIMKRINNALKENKELKSTLKNVIASLKEAAVTNHNLGQIIRLISENTTSQDEKMEIINRFAKEAKTIKESKNLYDTISRELKKANKMNITESKELTVNGSQKINETPIYKSQDLLESLDLMHRMMK